MDTKSIGVGIVATLLVLSTVGAGAFIATGGLDSNQSASPQETQPESPPQETVSEDEVPDDVKASAPAAKALKQNLTDEGYNASVSITQRGEIVVSYSSDAGNGPELKDDMAVVAKQYAAVAGNETGGLTVAANGVKLMVSSDAAIAHDDGKLNEEAFEKTFHWGTVESDDSDE